VSELLDVRVIGAPEVAEMAVARVGELAVAHHGRHYRVGRLLHPDQPTPPGGEQP
jgi:hypothetical protein